MEKEELVMLFTNYLDEKGLFFDFKEFAERQGYELSELGIENE